MKKFILFWKLFFLMVWEIVKSMQSIRGLLSLLISYMIFHGWAVLFLGIGLMSGNGWLIGVGSAVILFWFGPGTPVIPLILIVALFIQRYIFMDMSNKMRLKDKWIELKNKNYFKSDEKLK
jgi:hypothetical protein